MSTQSGMHIVMASIDYLPSVGGIAAHVHELSKALTALGHHVTVLAKGDGCESDTTDGVHVIRTPFGFRRLRLLRGRRYQWALATLWAARGALASADVLHFHVLGLLGAGRLWGRQTPRVFTNHASDFVESAAVPDNHPALKRDLLMADWVIACSSDRASLTAEVGYPADRVSSIPNGVDTARFSPDVPDDGLRAAHGASDGEILILCPCRLERVKGVAHLVSALPMVLRRCPLVRLLVAGDGIERAHLEAAAVALGVRDKISFAGSVPNSDMPSYYAASDIVVVPSLVEATSIAALEAMSTAKPVVATRVGGLPELIQDGVSGVLVAPADEAELAAAIVPLARDPALRRCIGKAARERVLREFTWQAITSRTLEVYREVSREHLARARNGRCRASR